MRMKIMATSLLQTLGLGLLGPAACLATLLLGASSTSAGAAGGADAALAPPLTIIVPFTPGGDSDLSARALAPFAQKYLHASSVQVLNKPGAAGQGGVPSTKAFLEATPDGNTVLMGRGGNIAVAPALMVHAPYTPEDFTILAVLQIDPLVCAVRADSPYQKPRDVVDDIRARPGAVRYSTAGIGSVQNLSVLYFVKISGLKPDGVKAVHLASSGDATRALLDGEVELSCGSVLLMVPHIKSGRLRGLFGTSPTGRLAQLPAMPSAQEVGLRDMSKMVGWSVLVAPPKMPAPALARWRTALQKIADDPQWVNGIEQSGGLVAIKSLPRPAEFVNDQFNLYEELGINLGLRK
ncbi:hypothetical protein DBR47_04080 [Paucibacter sp. KBW04]|nr:hypothetical protein DBR47_04080 [Paucibacter sp. KBW04]